MLGLRCASIAPDSVASVVDIVTIQQLDVPPPPVNAPRTNIALATARAGVPRPRHCTLSRPPAPGLRQRSGNWRIHCCRWRGLPRHFGHCQLVMNFATASRMIEPGQLAGPSCSPVVIGGSLLIGVVSLRSWRPPTMVHVAGPARTSSRRGGQRTRDLCSHTPAPSAPAAPANPWK